MEPIVQDVIRAVAERDWDGLRPRLHPYLHWRGGDGTSVRGRRNVLRLLAAAETLAPPADYELRDGQIYRWKSR